MILGSAPTLFSAKTNLIYLSYGNEREYKRSIFSVLSYLSWTDAEACNTRIIIYTDNPAYFQLHFSDHPIEYHLLEDQEKEQMLAGKGFLHRLKVAVMDLTFEKYPGDNLIFIDSDTFFVKDFSSFIATLKPGKSLMHKREYDLEEGLASFSSFNQGQYPKALIAYITGRNFMIQGNQESFDQRDYSYNSGVVGLSCDMSAYMPYFYQLTDEFYANSKWFISEQLAFSFILQRRTEITTTDSAVLHYWGARQKRLMDKSLDVIFVRLNPTKINKPRVMKSLIKNYRAELEIDLLLEQVEIAVIHGSWIYAFKKSLQMIAKNPLNRKIYQNLRSAFQSGGGNETRVMQ